MMDQDGDDAGDQTTPMASDPAGDRAAYRTRDDQYTPSSDERDLPEPSGLYSDWIDLCELASDHALTELGMNHVLGLADDIPRPSLDSARQVQLDLSEALALLDRTALWEPLRELRDPLPAIDRLARGGVLDVPELATIKGWMGATEAWAQVPREELRGEKVKKTIQLLPNLSHPLSRLEKILTPEGLISENASPDLFRLSTELRKARAQVETSLDDVKRRYQQLGYLQEDFVDLRDGKYVLPVRIGFHQNVPGTVTDASSTKQTLYIEPVEISQITSRCRALEAERIAEIQRILREFSKLLEPEAPGLRLAVGELSRWDSLQARARFGRQYGGKPIHVIAVSETAGSSDEEKRLFYLHQTAHPLLWETLKSEQIVRNDIELSDPVRALLLTGPNTGGKTVLLKTIGLACLCARGGFLFPGSTSIEVPLFDDWFDDIGDTQSIEESVSSFSGHLLKFKEILENAGPRSLVLLDELNTATDPEEGAALARAVLETIIDRGAFVVATTHDPRLKTLALADNKIMNGSLVFDEQAGSPTYRLVLGVPGRSRAIETARRIGIPPAVIEKARGYLTEGHRKVEDLLAQLESDAQSAERARRQAEHTRAEAEKMREDWRERTQKSLDDVLDRTRQRLRRLLEQTQDQMRAHITELEKAKSRKQADEVRQSLSESFRQAITEAESALSKESPTLAAELAPARPEPQLESEQQLPPSLRAGQKVRVPKWKNIGTILKLEKKGPSVVFEVALGTLKLKLSQGDIEPISDRELVAAGISTNTVKSGGRALEPAGEYSPPGEIDLRGKRLDDAMTELGSYLDLVFRNGHPLQVTVVHGLGTGAIREGTRSLLRKLPYVKNFRDGGPGAGGSGATVVEFDHD